MTDLVGAQYWRLPEEMQHLNQWCLAGSDKAPCLVGPNGLFHTSPVQGPWYSFKEALTYAAQYSCHIGFIITAQDPYTCIDMDVKDAESTTPDGVRLDPALWTPAEQLQFYAGIVQLSGSYAELSASGKGLHVWVKGNIGAGRKGKGLELYSRERFIVCTGHPVSHVHYDRIDNVVIPQLRETAQLPITDGTAILETIGQTLGPNGAATKVLEEVMESKPDSEIIRIAMNAGNKDKFISLCRGNWQHEFPSQSEADLALLSMFTFYSKSNDQCRRLFRTTELGKRDKATRDDRYLDNTLRVIRGRQAGEAKVADHGRVLAEALLAKYDEPVVTGAPIPREDVDKIVDPVAHSIIQALDHSKPSAHAALVPVAPVVDTGSFDWPPGVLGRIAHFIYGSAPRQVEEVALVAALGLMAGVTGKAYNISESGLNLYVVLVARSAIGKEAMHTGLDYIFRSAAGPSLEPFYSKSDFVSGPALMKKVLDKSSFVNISGEWGKKLTRMAEGRDAASQGVRTAMTDLYGKSGKTSTVGGMEYSDKEKNVGQGTAVAFSMIGESTPGTFYDALGQDMMEDGFLSRFNVVEYLGDRPPRNRNQATIVPPDLAETIGHIAAHAGSLNASTPPNAINVQMDPQATAIYDNYDLHCDKKIEEAGVREELRQTWNRSYHKAMKIAAILAVCDDHINPCVTREQAEWAIRFIEKGNATILDKIQGGDVGENDTSRYKKLHSLLENYVENRGAPKGYKIPAAMMESCVIPRNYLNQRIAQVSCYTKYRNGAVKALDETLKTAIDNGVLQEIKKDDAVDAFGFHGRCFRILDLQK